MTYVAKVRWRLLYVFLCCHLVSSIVLRNYEVPGAIRLGEKLDEVCVICLWAIVSTFFYFPESRALRREDEMILPIR